MGTVDKGTHCPATCLLDCPLNVLVATDNETAFQGPEAKLFLPSLGVYCLVIAVTFLELSAVEMRKSQIYSRTDIISSVLLY